MLRKLAKSIRLPLLLTSALVLLTVSTLSVYACLDYIGTLSDGAVVSVSCGSSAGAVVWVCDSDGCTSDPADDADAQAWCGSSWSCQNARPQPGQIAGFIKKIDAARKARVQASTAGR